MSEGLTLQEHMKRIASIQTVKKHRAQVENLKKARAAREQKRRGLSSVLAAKKPGRFNAGTRPHVPCQSKMRKISIIIGGVQQLVEVPEK